MIGAQAWWVAACLVFALVGLYLTYVGWGPGPQPANHKRQKRPRIFGKLRDWARCPHVNVKGQASDETGKLSAVLRSNHFDTSAAVAEAALKAIRKKSYVCTVYSFKFRSC